MSDFLAYIDESGDPDFGSGSSETFFVCATILKSSDLESVEEAIAQILAKHDLRELKSARITSDKRRSAVLAELSDLPLAIFTIFVDKAKLSGDWFRYRQTFYKFIQRCLATEIYRIYGQLNATFDKFGTIAYQESFKKYMESKLQISMFIPNISIGSAKESSLVQMSDIFGGSIRKYYEGDYDYVEPIIRSIWKGKLRIPQERLFALATIEQSDSDQLLAQIAESSIDRYLEKYKSSAEKEVHIRVANYLKEFFYEEPEKYCFRAEICLWLKFAGIDISDETLSRTVLSDFKDEGVIITSSGDGVKLPRLVSELDDHYRMMIGQAFPILKRLKILDQVIEARMPSIHSDIHRNFNDDINGIIQIIHT